MTELPETLERALLSPLTLTFPSGEEARSWVYRAHNHIRRRAPHLAQLMISRRGSSVRLVVPQPVIKEG